MPFSVTPEAECFIRSAGQQELTSQIVGPALQEYVRPLAQPVDQSQNPYLL